MSIIIHQILLLPHNSLNFAAKICSDICPWTLSVPRSSQFSSSFALENCSLLGTDNVRGQISEHIFAPNEGYCVFIIWQAPREGSMRRILCYDWLPQRARCSNTALSGLPVSFPQVKFRQSSSRCTKVFFRRNYFLLR